MDMVKMGRFLAELRKEHHFTQAELGEKLGRPCRIVNGKKKGRIELEYYGTDDLNALLEALEKLGRK